MLLKQIQILQLLRAMQTKGGEGEFECFFQKSFYKKLLYPAI